MLMLASKYATDAGRAGLDGVGYISREWVPKLTQSGQELLRRDPPPEILRGDPVLARAAIRMAPGKLQYRSLVMSFARDDIDVKAFNAGAPEVRVAIDHTLRLYGEVGFAGVPESCRPPFFVTTHTHTGRLEINIIVPRWVWRPDGACRAFNPDPPGQASLETWNAFEDLLNARFGWSNPRDLARQQLVELPNWILKQRAAAQRSGDAREPDLRETLADALIAAAHSGEVQHRGQVIDWLESRCGTNGMVIHSVGAAHVTIGHAGAAPKQRIRLRGLLVSEDFSSPDVLQENTRQAGPSKVRHALARNGRLFSTGLIERPDWSRSRGLDLDVPRQLCRLIEGGCNTPAQFRDGLFPVAPQPTTAWQDFGHLGELHELLARVLKGAVNRGHQGINLLFYGSPGTGKTEFCKVLTRQIGKPLHAVGETDEDGEAPTGRERSSALRLAQRLMSGAQESVLLFDEMEDIFERDIFSALIGRRTGSSKIHLHRMLETNPVPVLWTTNDIESCDPALLRRMTLTVEMRTPGPRVREQVWKRLAETQDLPLGNDKIRELAKNIEVPPALVAGALGVAKLTEGGEHDLDLAVGAADKALRGGHPKPPGAENARAFDPALVVTDLDIDHLVGQLTRDDAPRNVSFCFYGPPGTGKSALARHLAEVMGFPVIQKRASDLMSMFVGGSEKAIASAFSQAREESAFLIFDEADSFLGDRALAARSWEVSQVNEMLTWMESHPLPFACTTNLADRLDPATRRRFTINAEMRPLGTPQLGIAFETFFGSKPPAGLFDLEGLTPGDMAAVSRRCNLLGERDGGSILDALRDEACAKNNGGIRPGFRQSSIKNFGDTKR